MLQTGRLQLGVGMESSRKASNFDMIHVGKERYWSTVDNMTVDVTGKLSHSFTRIVEVKIVSAIDEKLTLVI